MRQQIALTNVELDALRDALQTALAGNRDFLPTSHYAALINVFGVGSPVDVVVDVRVAQNLLYAQAQTEAAVNANAQEDDADLGGSFGGA